MSIIVVCSVFILVGAAVDAACVKRCHLSENFTI